MLADVGQGFLDGAVGRALRWFGPILSLPAVEVEGDVVAAVAHEPGDVGEPGLGRDGDRGGVASTQYPDHVAELVECAHADPSHAAGCATRA
ncbi:MAG TPA: hypothetical protein VK053_02575 [Jiangellaceae bacterium]|nr:hypothetical protein [Jiangellaceae bacterium]